MAIGEVEPSIPPGFGRIDSNVAATIVVDTKGKVICAAADKKSHPILKQISEEAAGQWLFKPFLGKGKPVVVSGIVIFHIRHWLANFALGRRHAAQSRVLSSVSKCRVCFSKRRLIATNVKMENLGLGAYQSETQYLL